MGYFNVTIFFQLFKEGVICPNLILPLTVFDIARHFVNVKTRNTFSMTF